MASLVDTSVKFLHSRMAGAPVLNGTAGALLGVLSACLVDGFDVKSVTSINVLAGVATVAYSGTHSSEEGAVVLMAGVTGGPSGFAGINGEQKITGKPTASSVTFATALPDGAYTGTMTIKMAPLGFTKPFTGTNKAVFKSANPASTGMFFRIDDAATTFARVIGYETMTDVDTGLGPFPTAAQMAGGGYWAKSTTANANANEWAVFGDDRMFFISALPGIGQGANLAHGVLRGFGDPVSMRASGDAYFCALNYSSVASVTTMHDGDFSRGDAAQTATPRNYLGVGGAERQSSYGYLHLSPTGLSGITADYGAFPNRIDGAMLLSKRYLRPEGAVVSIRGDVPGIYTIPQSSVWDTFRFLDVVPGAGILAGRRLRAVLCTGGMGFSSTAAVTTVGTCMVDTTGPWR